MRSSAGLKTVATVAATATLWLVALLGCVLIADSLAVLNMLRTGASPGDAIFLDTLAPSTRDAFLDLGVGVALLAAPFALRWALARWLRTRGGTHAH